MNGPSTRGAGTGSPRFGATQETMAGLLVMLLAAIAYWMVADLSAGTLRNMGPGLLPKGIALLIGSCGAILFIIGLAKGGERLAGVGLRAPVLVVAGIVAFALTIRDFGLAVAGPLAMIIGGFATPDARWRELIVFALVMTVFCVGLFRYALNLPIPVLILPGFRI